MIGIRDAESHSSLMFRRTIALVLWTYFGWYLTALAATVIGLPTLIAPLGGIAMAAIALHDWRSARRSAAVPRRLPVGR